MPLAPVLRLARLLALASLLLLGGAVSAEAANFKGKSITRERGTASGPVALSISDGKVTSFDAGYYPKCDNGTSFAGELKLAGEPAAIAADGTVTFPVSGKLGGYDTTVSGTVTLRDASEGSPAVTGLVSATFDFYGTTCKMERDLLVPADVNDVKPAHSQFGSLTMPYVTFDRVGNTLRKLYVGSTFYCPGGGTISWYAPSRDVDEVKLSKGGRFSVTGYDQLDSYGDGVSFTVRGRVTKRGASGTITVHARSFGEKCGNVVVRWKSSPPARPVAAGPDLSAELYSVRRESAAGFSYGLGAGRVTCLFGATHFRVTVAGRSKTTSCAAAPGVVHFLVMGLTPGKTYRVTLQALKVRGGRVVRRGARYPQTVRIALPGDPGWEPITGAAAR